MVVVNSFLLKQPLEGCMDMVWMRQSSSSVKVPSSGCECGKTPFTVSKSPFDANGST